MPTSNGRWNCPVAFCDTQSVFARMIEQGTALQIVAAAIAKTGSADDAQKVADTIKSGGPWATAIGPIGYDAKGDITRPDYVIYEWKKGEDGKPTYFQM